MINLSVSCWLLSTYIYVTVNATRAPKPCPTNFVQYTPFCATSNKNVDYPWAGTQQACASAGMQMPVIRDQNDFTALLNFVQTFYASYGGGRVNLPEIMIGATNFGNPNGTYLNVDQNDPIACFPTNSTLWPGPLPCPEGDPGTYLSMTSDGMLHERPMNESHRRVCVYPPPVNLTAVTTTMATTAIVLGPLASFPNGTSTLNSVTASTAQSIPQSNINSSYSTISFSTTTQMENNSCDITAACNQSNVPSNVFLYLHGNSCYAVFNNQTLNWTSYSSFCNSPNALNTFSPAMNFGRAAYFDNASVYWDMMDSFSLFPGVNINQYIWLGAQTTANCSTLNNYCWMTDTKTIGSVVTTGDFGVGCSGTANGAQPYCLAASAGYPFLFQGINCNVSELMVCEFGCSQTPATCPGPPQSNQMCGSNGPCEFISYGVELVTSTISTTISTISTTLLQSSTSLSSSLSLSSLSSDSSSLSSSLALSSSSLSSSAVSTSLSVSPSSTSFLSSLSSLSPTTTQTAAIATLSQTTSQILSSSLSPISSTSLLSTPPRTSTISGSPTSSTTTSSSAQISSTPMPSSLGTSFSTSTTSSSSTSTIRTSSTYTSSSSSTSTSTISSSSAMPSSSTNPSITTIPSSVMSTRSTPTSTTSSSSSTVSSLASSSTSTTSPTSSTLTTSTAANPSSISSTTSTATSTVTTSTGGSTSSPTSTGLTSVQSASVPISSTSSTSSTTSSTVPSSSSSVSTSLLPSSMSAVGTSTLVASTSTSTISPSSTSSTTGSTTISPLTSTQTSTSNPASSTSAISSSSSSAPVTTSSTSTTSPTTGVGSSSTTSSLSTTQPSSSQSTTRVLVTSSTPPITSTVPSSTLTSPMSTSTSFSITSTVTTVSPSSSAGTSSIVGKTSATLMTQMSSTTVTPSISTSATSAETSTLITSTSSPSSTPVILSLPISGSTSAASVSDGLTVWTNNFPITSMSTMSGSSSAMLTSSPTSLKETSPNPTVGSSPNPSSNRNPKSTQRSTPRSSFSTPTPTLTTVSTTPTPTSNQTPTLTSSPTPNPTSSPTTLTPLSNPTISTQKSPNPNVRTKFSLSPSSAFDLSTSTQQKSSSTLETHTPTSMKSSTPTTTTTIPTTMKITSTSTTPTSSKFISSSLSSDSQKSSTSLITLSSQSPSSDFTSSTMSIFGNQNSSNPINLIQSQSSPIPIQSTSQSTTQSNPHSIQSSNYQIGTSHRSTTTSKITETTSNLEIKTSKGQINFSTEKSENLESSFLITDSNLGKVSTTAFSTVPTSSTNFSPTFFRSSISTDIISAYQSTSDKISTGYQSTSDEISVQPKSDTTAFSYESSSGKISSPYQSTTDKVSSTYSSTTDKTDKKSEGKTTATEIMPTKEMSHSSLPGSTNLISSDKRTGNHFKPSTTQMENLVTDKAIVKTSLTSDRTTVINDVITSQLSTSRNDILAMSGLITTLNQDTIADSDKITDKSEDSPNDNTKILINETTTAMIVTEPLTFFDDAIITDNIITDELHTELETTLPIGTKIEFSTPIITEFTEGSATEISDSVSTEIAPTEELVITNPASDNIASIESSQKIFESTFSNDQSRGTTIFSWTPPTDTCEWNPSISCGSTCEKIRQRVCSIINGSFDDGPVQKSPISVPSSPMSALEKLIAEYMMRIGCIWLLIALGCSIISSVALRSKKYLSIIHLNQDISLFVAHLFVLLLAIRNDEKFSLATCKGAAIALQYFFLVTYSFQMLESLHIYVVLTNVIVQKDHLIGLKTAIALGWGVPSIITCATAATSYNQLVSQYSCWINMGNYIYLATFIPAVLIGWPTVVLWEATGQNATVMKSANADSCRLSRAGLGLVFGTHFSSWFIASSSIYYQRIPLFTVALGLNISLGILLVMYHLFANDKARMLARRFIARVMGGLNL